MKRSPGTARGRRAERHPLGALFVLAAFALIFAGCGITLSADEDESEMFRELTLEGDLIVGGALELKLAYEQPYPVDVAVECELRSAEEGTRPATPGPRETPPARPGRVLLILTQQVPANPAGGAVGEATPEAGVIQGAFSLPDVAGRYRVVCFTPDDETNAIGQTIILAPRPDPTTSP